MLLSKAWFPNRSLAMGFETILNSESFSIPLSIMVLFIWILSEANDTSIARKTIPYTNWEGNRHCYVSDSC